MVTVTELNRGANITANTIDAGSVSADALEAGGWSFIGEFQTLSDFESAASSGDRGYITDEQQFAYEP